VVEVDVSTGTALTVAGLLLTLFGLPVTLANLRRARSERTLGDFERVHAHVRFRQARLRALARSGIRPEWQADEIPMLTAGSTGPS
jgi:hypothetical protein